MAGELIAQLSAGDFYRETAVGYDDTSFSTVVGSTTVAAGGGASGMMRGVGLNKVMLTTLQPEYYQATFVIPANLTMGTGITVLLHLVDDGTRAQDLGSGVEIGVTAYNADATAFRADLSAGGGTEQTGTATLSSTSLQPATLSVAIASAQLAGAAVGNRIVLRIRRIGTSTSDTCPGRPILLAAYVHNT